MAEETSNVETDEGGEVRKRKKVAHTEYEDSDGCMILFNEVRSFTV
jgi:hypothetical protein